MSTIPNLLSMRASRGARGGRGRGRGASSSPGITHDAAIQGTDNDAAVSRLSAVDMGYLQDPYARYFVHGPDGLTVTRRLPIINRGTYTRTLALDTLVNDFLSRLGDGPKQIVSLGAGTDTRAFRLFAQGNMQGLVYLEIDFEVTCTKKLRIVQAAPLLANILTSLSSEQESSSWSSLPSSGGEYHCHGIDLRALTSTSPVGTIPGLRTDIPTLVLSECCLCYLSPGEATGVVEFFTAQIPDVGIAIYEPIRPDDAFGKMMVSNLATRRIHMPTLDVYRDGEAQNARLRQAGFETVQHMTVEDIWANWVAPEERERVDALEGLDEVEEWKLLAAHYVVAWGARGVGMKSWGAKGRS